MEKEIADMDHELLMNYDQTAAEPEFFDRYHHKKQKLQELMKAWESCATDLEG